MPDFGNPFSGLKHDRILTKEELIRAIRFLIAAEYEATQLYMQLAESIDDENVKKVLKEIADEETVHAGEFLRVLISLKPEEFKLYMDGVKEVEDLIKEAKYSVKDNVMYWETVKGKKFPIGVLTPSEGIFLKQKKKSISQLIKEALRLYKP